MKITDYQQFEIEFDCKEVRELLSLYALDRGDLSLDESWAIERHLDSCADCLAEYEGTKLVNDALIANRDYLFAEGVFEKPTPEIRFNRVSDEEADFLLFQAKMARAITRRKKAEAKARNTRLAPYSKAASAVAACLLIVSSLWWAIGNLQSDRSTIKQPIAAKPHITSVKIELVSDTGAVLIPAGQLIAATDKIKTLRINGNRDMTLNTGTQLSIVSHNFGCIVKLGKGEIYTHVEHDGNPFIVETPHGRAVITGTTFNIKADNTQMELTVIEGTVSFENTEGFVNVEAGYKSQIAVNSLPAAPIICDTDSIVAWATMPEAEMAVSRYVFDEIDLPITQEAPVLENIDYETWINENRDWFKRQFPEIFHIKEALAKDGIEVGYPHLLLRSNELWRFVYPPTSLERCIEPAALALKQLASLYGKDSQWLAEAVPTVNFAADTTTPLDIAATNMEMFNQWQTNLEQTRRSGKITNSALMLDSLHASVYLTKTRTLLWLSGIRSSEDEKILNSLEEQITKANEITVQVFELVNCDENTCLSRSPEIIASIEENISAIAGIEKDVQNNMACK
ncbi:hypothetical protein LCGC14_1510690 [marine sediment metagenome]|uniref:FecR protein domain-containing protein n=1 Tax=marine sediment metagenome TaxID=412755 RepID=A0A0F9JM83_9ZZZZ